MELTNEQIKRINDFLEGIGVEFLDIRFEMIDHIASEIEEKIEDKTSFFENRRFQTPFIKYMLSRKSEFVKIYQKQEKKLTWFYLKTIFKDVSKRFLKLQNLVLFSLLSIFCFVIGSNFMKETIIFMGVLLLINLVFGTYQSSTFIRKREEIKIVRVYMALFSIIFMIPFSFLNFISVFYDVDYTITTMYVYLMSFIFSYSLNQSFLHKKQEIENKFQFLIND